MNEQEPKEQDNSEEKPKKREPRLKGPEIAALLFVAVLTDIFSLIPGANIPVGIIGQMLIALLFVINNVNVFSKKRAVPYILGFIIEVIPVISIIPAFTLETIIIIAITRFEDKTGMKVPDGKEKLPLAA